MLPTQNKIMMKLASELKFLDEIPSFYSLLSIVLYLVLELLKFEVSLAYSILFGTGCGG